MSGDLQPPSFYFQFLVQRKTIKGVGATHEEDTVLKCTQTKRYNIDLKKLKRMKGGNVVKTQTA